MAKIQLGLAPTSVKLRVKLMNSSVTTGAGLTGLSSASSGLIISTIQLIEGANGEASATVYTVAASNVETITTLGTYAAPSSNKCRFKEVDSTNHPGVYELQFADARFSATGDATKAMTLLISISGATNLAQADIEVECRNQAVNVIQINGTAQTARDIGASVLLSSGTGTGQLDFTSGVVKANQVQVDGSANATHATGMNPCDARDILGTAISTPATAGILDVNVKNMNNVAATSITTINANQGTTQPINFTGTGASAYAKSDMVDIAGVAVSTSTAQLGVNLVNIAGSAVSTSTAQLGVNAVQHGGTAQTGRDIGASVLLSSGTGTGQLDFTSGVVKANITQCGGSTVPSGAIPNAAAGATGGIFIAGTNAATTITSSSGSALTLSSTGSNGNGLVISGNGSGHGISSTGGATGNGFYALGGATSGYGIHAYAPTDGNGIRATATGNFSAFACIGAGTGSGISATGGSSNGSGFAATGNGSGSGIIATGGNSATTAGLSCIGGASGANGIYAAGHTAGNGILASGGNSATTGGIKTQGGSATAVGFYAVGNTTGSGFSVAGGATGYGMYIASTNANALQVAAGGTGNGANFAGGTSSGHGIQVAATTDGAGASFVAVGNNHGITISGSGTGSGVASTGGATGKGVEISGGATSGDAVKISTTNGHGVYVDAFGSGKHGMILTSENSGNGLAINGGATSGAAVKITAINGRGVDIDGNTDGVYIVGGLSGMAIAGLTGCGISAVGGGEDAKHAGIYAGGGSEGTGAGIYAEGGESGHAMVLSGTGDKSALYCRPGATGIGIDISGGATSGNAVSISTVSGHGISVAATGSGKHGLVVTGSANGSGAVITGGSGYGVYITGTQAGLALGGTYGMLSVGATAGIFASGGGEGASGIGLLAEGGGTSGDGFKAVSYAGQGINAIGGGTSGSGMLLTRGGASGYDLKGATPSTNLPISVDTAAVADAVWDEAISGHLTSGTTGAKLNAAASAGDPWSTALPGSYGAGTAGKIVGDNLNATVSSRLAPTVAGRTLDVTSTGAAGIDWGNLENPTTSNGLSGTTISTSQQVASVSGAVGSVTGNVGGNVTGSVGSVASGGITASSIATGAITNAKFAAGAIDASAIATDAIGSDEISAAAVTKIQNGLATPTNITAGTITTVTNLTNAPTAGDFTATMKASITTAASSATPTVTLAASQPNYAPAKAGDAMALTAGERTSTGTAVWATTTRALTDKAGFTISGTKQTLDALNDVSTTQVNAEVDTALSDIKLDHLIAVAESGDVVNSSIIAKLASKSGTPAFSSFNNTTDSLEAIADGGGGGGGLTAQEVRDAMKLAPTVGAPATGSIDKELDDIQAQTDMLHFTGDYVQADMQEIDGNANAATNLAASAETETRCTVDTTNFAPTTTQFETSTAISAKTRWVIFRPGSSIAGEAKPITACELISGKYHLTCEAFTAAPIHGDSFVIV